MSTPPELLKRFVTSAPVPEILIERATIDAYKALAPLHYRAGPPATTVLVLSARHNGHEAGVLVVSMPVLNADWRAGVWPDLSPGGDKSLLASRVNTSLRTISRVVVDPRHRGVGVARALVESYLADPLTPRTEALASMGRAIPFFERAGMRRVDRPEPSSLRRLRRELESRCVRPEALLSRPSAFARRRLVRAAVMRWASSGRAAASKQSMRWPELARAAAGALLARLDAYVHETESSPITARRGAPKRGDPIDANQLANTRDRG